MKEKISSVAVAVAAAAEKDPVRGGGGGGGGLPPRRRRTGSSSTSSLSSSLCPSPSHSTRSSFSSASSAASSAAAPFSVPFSWERQPGVPKIPGVSKDHLAPSPLLPLPPPLRSASVPPSRKKKPHRPFPSASIDPFAAALATCIASDDHRLLDSSNLDDLWPGRRTASAISLRGTGPIGNRLSLFGFQGSCNAAAACHVAPSTVRLPQTSHRRPAAANAHALLNRRSG